MNKQDLLKQKSKPKLATSRSSVITTAVAVQENELDRITMEIRSDIEELQEIQDWWQQKKVRVVELKQAIVENLIYIRDNKKDMLPDRTLEDYITADLGLSRGYFYDQIKAYEFVNDLNAPERFEDVDYKILVGISRFKDASVQKALLDKSDVLTRDDLKRFKENEDDISASDVRKSAGRTFAVEPETNAVSIDRKGLSFSVSDKTALKRIEALLKQEGFVLDFV